MIESREGDCSPCRIERDALRTRVATLANENMRLHEEIRALREMMHDHVVESSRMMTKRVHDEWGELVREHEVMASLQAASMRLDEGLEQRDVLRAVEEIVINLIGSEQFVVMELNPEEGELVLSSAFGLDPAKFQRRPIDDGVFARVVHSGEPFVRDPTVSGPLDEPDLTVAVPLKLQGRTVGVLAIYRLLDQKPRLKNLDHELLALISTRAAPALWCSRVLGGSA